MKHELNCDLCYHVAHTSTWFLPEGARGRQQCGVVVVDPSEIQPVGEEPEVQRRPVRQDEEEEGWEKGEGGGE